MFTYSIRWDSALYSAVRKLLALLLFSYSTAFACEEESSPRFSPFATQEQKFGDGLTQFTIYFPISDMSESPMYFSGLAVKKAREYRYYVESIESDAHPNYIEATVFVDAEDISTIDVLASYNFCDRDGGCFSLCGNVKKYYLDELVGDGE